MRCVKRQFMQAMWWDLLHNGMAQTITTEYRETDLFGSLELEESIGQPTTSPDFTRQKPERMKSRKPLP